MTQAQSLAALCLFGLIAAPGVADTPEISASNDAGFFAGLTQNYRPRPVRGTNFNDTRRIESLIRAGAIYLSLRDAIALALENNLDIENARYNPLLSDANVLRASAGTLLRNVSNSISQGPSSASLGVSAGAQLGAAGVASSTNPQQGVLSGLSVQLAGTSIPNLDPQFFAVGQFSHLTQIETATNITGTSFLTNEYKSAMYGIQDQFLTGTTVSLGMSSQLGVRQNSPYNNFNPFSQANLQLSIQQNLLQGFRPSVNKRAIIVARNQRHISDLTFKNQVMATVANVAGLYWDLVSFNDTLKIRQRTLDLNTHLYRDNQRRAEVGAIAPIDIIQAEAEMKAAQQDVTNAQTQVLQQEMILKSVLTRNGLDNLEIVSAHVIPTDHFEVPEQEETRPIQDLMTEALASRPDVEQSSLGLEDSRVNLRGTRDAMLPQLTAFASLQNSGLAGEPNGIPVEGLLPGGVPGFITRGAADVPGFFLGGYGTVLSQIFSRNFPNYSVGVQLNIPIHNRSTRADYITDALNYRQSQIQDKQLRNSVRLNVINAQTALTQARAAYQTSVEARQLEDQTLAGTRRKYELGTANIIDLLTTQRDDTTRELSEVSALNQYIHASINLDNSLGRILRTYDVSLDEALKAQVSRPPDPIPAVLQP